MLFLVNCNNSPELNTFLDSNKSKSKESQVLYSEAELETMGAGEGITVGNGRDDTEEEINSNTESFFLACTLSVRNNFQCKMSVDLAPEDIPKEKIMIFDDKGNQIPSDLFVFKVVEIDNEKLLEIFINSEATAQKILVNGVDKTTNEANTDKTTDEVNPDEASEEDDSSKPDLMLMNCNEVGPGTWILVPGDPNYGTNNFCVMKYEAKNISNSPASEPTGTPWVFISQEDARTECTSLGQGYHLVTNNEWMTIATNITNIANNWSGGSVGSGSLFRGHTDNNPSTAQGSPCAASANDSLAYLENNCTPIASGGAENDETTQRRTHDLSNGSVIWDLSGNVWEWVDYYNIDQKPTPNGYFWREFTDITGTSALPLSDLIPTNAVTPFWNDTWNSTQSIGQMWAGPNTEGGSMHRGGDWDDMVNGGVFASNLHAEPTPTYDAIGFRCAFSAP